MTDFIIVAGPTEAGKSSVGQLLEANGALRLKVPRLLEGMRSGLSFTYGGKCHRYLFRYDEFAAKLQKLADGASGQFVVVESFIDPLLFMYLRRRLRGRVRLVVVCAPFEQRVERELQSGGSATVASARLRVIRKDIAKAWPVLRRAWRRLADVTIDNSQQRSQLLTQLAQVTGASIGPLEDLLPAGRRLEVSAGTVVVRLRDSVAELLVLFQTRKHGEAQCVFAKGHVERGESHLDAALRELREEAGVEVPTARFLRVNRYVFDANGRSTIKLVHWFVARLDEDVPLVPRLAEGFREARWVSLAEAQNVLTHASDRELAEIALRQMEAP